MKVEKSVEDNISKMLPRTSIHIFLSGLIDYAGLFPPASLSLETAIRNYAAYRVGEDAWMLGRFIIPAAQLDELHPYMSLFLNSEPLAISALGRKSKKAVDCLEGLRTDLHKIDSFCDNYKDAVKVEVFELPLPTVIPKRELLEVIAVDTAERGLHTFCEVTVPLHTDWEHYMFETLDVIAQHNAETGIELGVKLRTGGVTADAFPSPEQMAAVLTGCRDRGIAMKFTAGLHHPIRMFREEVNTKMHGFLNVFTAGMLTYAYNLDVATTAEILTDETPASFSLTTKRLAWRNLMLSLSEIEHLRKTALHSYGSCSFDEPREDLQALGIL